MTIKRRELFLLISYLVILISYTRGQLLSINCCGNKHEAKEITCCCEGRQRDTEYYGRPEASTLFESTPVEPGICYNSRCLCVDVPLDTSEPYHTRQVDPIPPSFGMPTYAMDTVFMAENYITPYNTSAYPTNDADRLNTIILLI